MTGPSARSPVDPGLKPWATPDQAAKIDAVNTHGSNRKAAKALGLTENAIGQAIRAVRKKAARDGYPDPATAAPEPPTLDEAAALHRAKSDQAFDRARLKEALAEINRLRDRMRQYEWAAPGARPSTYPICSPRISRWAR